MSTHLITPTDQAVADSCPTCDGTGRVENDTDSLTTPMWADCRDCDGTGHAPEPEENPRPVDVDDCPRCEGQGMFVVHVDGEAAYRLCSWCTGTGERGAA